MNSNTIIHALEFLADELEPLLPLANCHMVDFLTQGLWDEHIAPALAMDLDTISQDELSCFLQPPEEKVQVLAMGKIFYNWLSIIFCLLDN